MRYPLILFVSGLFIIFYYLLHMEYVNDILETGYNTTSTTVGMKSKEINATFNLSRLFPPSTYDVDIVNWTLTCTLSPAYLADLAYTLKLITDVLEEFEISYFLDSATLIGALRMNGPLPYDDDIDIMILEEDFKPKKDLVYDAMGRKFRVVRHKYKRSIDQFYHLKQYNHEGFRRPVIDIFMLKVSSDKNIMKLVCSPGEACFRLVFPFKKSTIFRPLNQTPPTSIPIPTLSAPRAPQVIPRALEAAWYHYKDHQRKARGVFRPGLQRILHHRYGMLSTVMFLGRLYPVAADSFTYADSHYTDWNIKHYFNRPHLSQSESALCRNVGKWVSMDPLQSNISSQHKRGAAMSAYIMLQRLKETMCYQTMKYSSDIITIEEELNVTDTMLFRQMCSMEEALCNAPFSC